MISKLLLTLLLISFSCGKRISFTDCGDENSGKIDWVDVVPCEKEPCRFPRGTQVTLTAEGTARHDSSGGQMKITAELGGIEVEIPPSAGIDPDICKTVECPIKSGKKYQVKYQITIEDYWPTITTKLKVQAIGDNDIKLLCAFATVGIV